MKSHPLNWSGDAFCGLKSRVQRRRELKPASVALPGNFLIVVDSFVRVLSNSRNSNFERITNPQKRRHGNRTTSFDLLPMARRESEGNHMLLAVAACLAELLDSPRALKNLE